jgi:hypothetical protein
VREVLRGCDRNRAAYTVITVGGTNGKGSCVALLDAILRAAGYRVGAYTSPHLLRYNERIRMNGAAVDDAAICQAFARIDAVRGDISLTYFEFGTLAALELFRQAGVAVAVLEVGLGGRLDAVNCVDADAALVVSIGILITLNGWDRIATASVTKKPAFTVRPTGHLRRSRPYQPSRPFAGQRRRYPHRSGDGADTGTVRDLPRNG